MAFLRFLKISFVVNICCSVTVQMCWPWWLSLLGLSADNAGCPSCQKSNQRDIGTRVSNPQCAFLFCRCWRPAITAPALVSVLRQRPIHSVPGIVQRVRPGSVRGSLHEPSRRIVQHLRHDRQQQIFHARLHNSLPEQVWFARRKGTHFWHPTLFSTILGQLEKSTWCSAVWSDTVRRASSPTHSPPLSSFYDRHRHGEH